MPFSFNFTIDFCILGKIIIPNQPALCVGHFLGLQPSPPPSHHIISTRHVFLLEICTLQVMKYG